MRSRVTAKVFSRAAQDMVLDFKTWFARTNPGRDDYMKLHFSEEHKRAARFASAQPKFRFAKWMTFVFIFWSVIMGILTLSNKNGLSSGNPFLLACLVAFGGMFVSFCLMAYLHWKMDWRLSLHGEELILAWVDGIEAAQENTEGEEDETRRAFSESAFVAIRLADNPEDARYKACMEALSRAYNKDRVRFDRMHAAFSMINKRKLMPAEWFDPKRV